MGVTLALLAGFTVVLNRTLNAEAGTRLGLMPSTAFNYITGLLTSLLVLLIVREPWAPFSIGNPVILTGGLIGVLVVLLSSCAAPHLSAFLMTLLVFVSQFVTALIIDAIGGMPLSALKALGGLCVLAGLIVYVLGERRVGH